MAAARLTSLGIGRGSPGRICRLVAAPNKSLHRTPTRNTMHSSVLHFVVRVGAGELRALDRLTQEVVKEEHLR